MRNKLGMTILGVFVVAAVVSIVWAQSAPQLINYQGRLTDSSGQPLADGTTVDLTFAFYGSASGDTAYLTVFQEDVVITDGIYNVLIGSGTITPGTESTLDDVFQNHSDVWMGAKVDTESEMTPRSRVGSVPYALNASDDGVPKGVVVMWGGSVSNIPAGWQLCDGTNGAPDLRDRFIMAAPTGQEPGQTGGANQITLTTSNMPSHSHTITVVSSGIHAHNYTDSWLENDNADFWVGGLAPTSLAFSQHSDAVTRTTNSHAGNVHSASASTSGNGTSFENRPAYYTLAFIIKM
jgi:microcystin-dependent protein